MFRHIGSRESSPVWLMVIAGMIVAAACTAPAQTAHQVPFSSKGNVVELLLENAGSTVLPGLTVRLTNHPPWIKTTPEEQVVGGWILPGKPASASFAFDVDRSAPVGPTWELVFTVTAGGGGERWTKSIAMSVLPPERFELLKNYPNPFNPSTTIGFTLPHSSQAILKVYNLLGEEVATLAEGTFEPGFHEVTWDASRAASGVYLYRLTASGSVLTGRMMVLK